jgi:hypothetical protein
MPDRVPVIFFGFAFAKHQCLRYAGALSADHGAVHTLRLGSFPAMA